jgi:hypothetical protein
MKYHNHTCKTVEIKYLLILVILFIFQFISNAQPVTQEWVRSYGYQDSLNDLLNDMALDSNGNIIVTGRIATSSQNTNYATVKYNPLGIQQWVATYNGPGSNSIDESIAVCTDINGNVYITGYSEEYGFLTDAYCTIKYDSLGNQLWLARYKNLPNGMDDPTAIAVDYQGNVYVTGSSQSFAGFDYLTIKYDSNGDSLWVRRYRGPGTANPDNYAYSICLDNQGNVYVTGESPEGLNSREACTIKYNSQGVQQWVVRHDTVNASGGYKVIIDRLTNDVYICGYWGGGGPTPQYLMVSKISSGGIKQWTKYYTGGISEAGYDIRIDNSHNIFVVGKAIFTQPIEDNYITIKYNTNGDTLWVRRFNVVQSTNSYPALTIDKFNNVYITGIRWQTSNYEFVTLKYDNGGNQKWLMTYPGGGAKINVDINLNVYVAGNNSSAGTGVDYITIKYSQPNGIIPIGGNLPVAFNLSQNYPNPFNPITKIKFEAPPAPPEVGMQIVSLKIYDVLGREVSSIFSSPWGRIGGAAYEVDWNGSNYPSGVYFYRLEVGVYTQTKKMVLVK